MLHKILGKYRARIKDLKAIRTVGDVMKRKPKTHPQTKQQLLLEVEELRTKLNATERRLQEASELLQANRQAQASRGIL